MSKVPRLVIREEFVSWWDSSEILRHYVVNNSKINTQLLNNDIQKVIENLPYKPYSLGFYVSFFDSILGDNTIYRLAGKMFDNRHRSVYTNFYFSSLHTFLEKFTNISDVVNSFINKVNSIPDTQTWIIVDKKTCSYYWFLYEFCSIKRKKEIKTKGIFLRDGSILIFSPIQNMVEVIAKDPIGISFVRMPNRSPVFERDIEAFVSEHNAANGFEKYKIVSTL